MTNSLARKTISVSILAFILCGPLFGLVSTAKAASLDIGQVQIVPGALSDVASWPQTTSITVNDLGGGGVSLDFDKKSSADGWPKQYSSAEAKMPGVGIGDAINHTVWVFRNVGGQWYGTGILQALGNYNDPTGTLANVPCGSLNNTPQMNPGQDFKVGEQIAFMVTAGSERGSIVSSIKERSDIQLYTVTADNLTGRDPGCGNGVTGGDTGSGTTDGTDIAPSKDLPVPNAGLPTDLGSLVQSIFAWSLSIIGLVIFVRFFYAGFLWFTSAGDTGRIGRARDIMKNAAYGTAVLFSAFLILNTINPDLVHQTFNLQGIPATVPADQVPKTSGSTGTTLLKNLCVNGFCSSTGTACSGPNQCGNNSSSSGSKTGTGSSTATCVIVGDAGDGTCSNDPKKICYTDPDCSPSNDGTPTCLGTDDGGNNGHCSNDPTKSCQQIDLSSCE